MEILTSQELLKQQLEEITTQQAARTKAIEPAKQIGVSYNANLQRLVASINLDFIRQS